MYNKKVLIDSLKKLGSAKAPTQKKDMIIDPMGQWAHPGENTRIPSNNITMDNVPYPVYADPNVGPSRMMYPEQEYNFPGADYVDEYPQMKSGGNKLNHVVVKQSKIPGANKGLFSNQSFRKGQLIGLAHSNGQPVGKIGNMHNHSDQPNMYSVKHGNERYVYAKRDIQPGEELTTNYRLQPELEQPEDFMRKGGSTPKLPNKKNSRAYSRSLDATNRLFAEHPWFKKTKSRKNKIYDPNAKYYQDGGDLPQNVGITYLSEDDRSHYNPLDDTIYLNPNASDSELNHELVHAWQNRTGRLRSNPNLPQQRPPIVASDEQAASYYTRKGDDVDYYLNNLSTLYPNLTDGNIWTEDINRFIPEQIKYDKVIDPLMYLDPNTMEGEAEMFSQVYGPPPGISFRKKGGALPKAQKGLSHTQLMQAYDDSLALYNSYNQFMNVLKNPQYKLPSTAISRYQGRNQGFGPWALPGNLYQNISPVKVFTYYQGNQPWRVFKYKKPVKPKSTVNPNQANNFITKSKPCVPKTTVINNVPEKAPFGKKLVGTNSETVPVTGKKCEYVQTINPIYEDLITEPIKIGTFPLKVEHGKLPELQPGNYFSEPLPEAPQYALEPYTDERLRLSIEPGKTKSKKHHGRLFGHGQKYSWHTYKPSKDLELRRKEVVRPIPALVQKLTGYDPKYFEGYEDEEGNFIPGELDYGNETGGKMEFRGAASLRDYMNQQKYAKEYEEYQKKLDEWDERYEQSKKKQEEGRAFKKGGALPKAQDGIPQEFYQNWYQNRIMPTPEGQKLLDKIRPEALERSRQMIPYIYSDKLKPDDAGYYDTKTQEIILNKFLPEAQIEATKQHEFGHHIQAGDKFYNVLDKPHQFLVEQNIIEPEKISTGNSEWDEKLKENYDYVTQPDEMHARVMTLRRLAGFQPNQVITEKDLKDYFNRVKEAGEALDPDIEDLRGVTKGNQSIVNLLNDMVSVPSNREDLNVAQDGGEQDGMLGMMKSKLAYANEFRNPAAKRMINIPDNPYDFGNGMTGTHYMASMDNYAVPQIQDENGQLVLGDYGPDSKEAIKFDRPEDAEYFAEHYKEVSPGFIEAELTPEEIEQYAKGGYIVEDISIPTLTKAQKGLPVKNLINTAKNFARTTNIGTLGTLNTLAKNFAPVMINPARLAVLGSSIDKVGPFTGSPLNAVPFYGVKMESTPGTAFRKFGDTLDYVKFFEQLNPAHGPLLRMGKNQIMSEGNWAELNEPNEQYPGVFGAQFDTRVPGSDLSFKNIPKRNGVLVTDASGNLKPIIPLSEPGLSFHRRLPFSNRYIPVDMDKLRNNEFDWRTVGGNTQSLLERYGYAAGYAGLLGAMGLSTPQEYLDEYINEPIMKGYNKYIKPGAETIYNTLKPKRYRQTEYGTIEEYSKGGSLPKAQNGKNLITLAKNLSKLKSVNPGVIKLLKTEYKLPSNMLSSINTSLNIGEFLPNLNLNETSKLIGFQPTLSSDVLKKYIDFNPVKITGDMFNVMGGLHGHATSFDQFNKAFRGAGIGNQTEGVYLTTDPKFAYNAGRKSTLGGYWADKDYNFSPYFSEVYTKNPEGFVDLNRPISSDFRRRLQNAKEFDINNMNTFQDIKQFLYNRPNMISQIADQDFSSRLLDAGISGYVTPEYEGLGREIVVFDEGNVIKKNEQLVFKDLDDAIYMSYLKASSKPLNEQTEADKKLIKNFTEFLQTGDKQKLVDLKKLGGEFELGDEVDEATMEELKKLGFTFEEL